MTWPPNEPLNPNGAWDWHSPPEREPWVCVDCGRKITPKPGRMPLRDEACQELREQKDLAPLEDPEFISNIRAQLRED